MKNKYNNKNFISLNKLGQNYNKNYFYFPPGPPPSPKPKYNKISYISYIMNI